MTTDRLDPDKIEANLKTRRIGTRVLLYRSTSSTNDAAAEYARNKENDGLVIFAEEQTKGRGRAGARWHSGRADSILCSIVLANSEISAELLSLTCAVAVAETIGKVGQTQAKVKWPNDIVLNGEKVAGILLESKPGDADRTYIIGIGINCHQKKDSFPRELQSTATSIDIEGQTPCDRIVLAKRLLTMLEHWLGTAQEDAEKVIRRWRRLSVQLGQRITLSYDGKKFTGHCIGIDPEKGLILQLETGGVRMFPAVHTSVAKRG